MARLPERRSHIAATFRSGGGVGQITRRQRDPEADWRSYPDAIELFHKRRLRNVRFCRGDAVETMTAYDSVDTLNYVDPPYSRSTPRRGHHHEMTVADHERLLDCVVGLAGNLC